VTAAAAYAAIALIATWPLALGLGSALPSDLGDPVLNCWILARNAGWLLDVASGQAVAGFWDAGIFHPAPLTLAHSEHLVAPTLQALPVYAATGNVVLAYNLLFLSTFVLSGLGAFLLVRELTGSAPAAFLAGLFYGFAPYRVDQVPHLQVLSSQWMPFALLGLRRFVSSGRPLPLIGAVVALLAQNLSCGYFVLYLTPFAGLYALFELHRQGRLGDWRRLAGLAIAAAALVATTLPFLLPYAALRARGVLVRGQDEVESFSADVFSYLTAPERLLLWGDVLDFVRRPEGALFPGLVPLALAAATLVTAARRGAAATGDAPAPPASRGAATRRLLVLALSAVLVLQLVFVVLFLGGVAARLPMTSPILPGRGIGGAVWRLVLVAVALGIVSPRARALARRAAASESAFFLFAALLAGLLSLGPSITALGVEVADRGPYTLLYENVPGFGGLRVPARFGMAVVLFVAVLAGLGAAALLRRLRGPAPALALGLLFLVESLAAPIDVHSLAGHPALRPLVGREGPAIYRRVAELPADAVLAEMPVQEDPMELWFMVPALQHRRRLVNGYSGVRAPGYASLRPQWLVTAPEGAWAWLQSRGATHAIVHESGWGIPAKGRRVTRWLEERGARLLAREGTDALLELPYRPYEVSRSRTSRVRR
jgi:hypothetical protein